jgi:hypothetical protein
MLRNCAAILFVCFDMTACDTLSLFSRRTSGVSLDQAAPGPTAIGCPQGGGSFLKMKLWQYKHFASRLESNLNGFFKLEI